MIRPTIKVNTSVFDRRMASLKQETPSATAMALTRAANYARSKEEDATRTVFNAPTLYTQRAFFTKWATKNNLTAIVGVKNQEGGRLTPVHWLFAQVEGGSRTQKAFERALTSMGFLASGHAAVPTHNIALDSYGNVSGGTIRSILSQLQRRSFVGPQKQRRRAAANAIYFAVPSGQKSRNLGPGIYKRMERGIQQVMVFTSQMPRYSKRLDFYEIGQKAARERFPIEVRLAMREMVEFR